MFVNVNLTIIRFLIRLVEHGFSISLFLGLAELHEINMS